MGAAADADPEINADSDIDLRRNAAPESGAQFRNQKSAGKPEHPGSPADSNKSGHLRDRTQLAKPGVSSGPSGTATRRKRPCRSRIKRRTHARCRCRRRFDRCHRLCGRLRLGGRFLRRLLGNRFLGCFFCRLLGRFLFRGLFRRFLRRFLRRFFGRLFGCFLCCFLCWFLCCHDDLLREVREITA